MLIFYHQIFFSLKFAGKLFSHTTLIRSHGQLVSLLPCIQDIMGSSPGPEIICTDRDFVWFSPQFNKIQKTTTD